MTFVTHPDARKHWRSFVRDIARNVITPRERLGLVRWAERHRRLDKTNSIKGAYRVSETPYLAAIAAALDNRDVWKVVVVKPARVGATELLINTRIGQVIDEDPGPILVIWPTREDAVEWSKDTLPDLLTETKVLRGKVSDAGEKDSENTILYKKFSGGSLIAIGSNSPRQLRRRKARYVLVDELDVCDAQSKEGDVVARAVRRTDTYHDRKVLFTGSPTRIEVQPDGSVTGSRIWREFLDSNQQYLHVPCPHCGCEQRLRLSSFHWDKGPGAGIARHLFHTAHFRCVACEGRIEESHKRAMVQRARFIAANPDHTTQGFFIGGFVSLFPGASWALLAQQYYAATQDKSKYEEFVQQVLGEPYEDRALRGQELGLAARRESYAADVPLGACILTAGVDKQGDRLELLVTAWGPGQEQWQVAHHRIFGDTSSATDQCWKALDRLLFRPFLHEGGAIMHVRCALVDSGSDATTVYQYTRPRQGRMVFAAKGDSTRDTSFVVKPGKSGHGSARLFFVSPDKCKDVLFKRLTIGVPGPGFIHFPLAQPDGLDDEYLSQFSNEKPVPKRVRGKLLRVWEQIGNRPNEAIDVTNYAFAALHVLGPAVMNFLPQLHVQVLEKGRQLGGLESTRARMTAAAAHPIGAGATDRGRIISRGVND